MAKAGTINEVIDIKAVEAQFSTVDKYIDALVVKIEGLNKAAGNIKGAGNAQQQNAAQAAANKQAQEAVSLTAKLTEEELKAAKAKQEKAYRTKLANDAAKEEINANKEIVGAYKALETEAKKATKAARDLAAQYGANSKEAKAASDAANKLNSDLKQIDATMNLHQKNVGNYKSAFDGLKQSWIIGTAAVGAVAAAIGGTLKTAIDSTAATSNQFKIVMSGLEFASKEFFRVLATGDFTNLISRMYEAIEAGMKYKETLIAIKRETDAVNIRASEERVELEKLKTAQRNVSLSREERMAAGRKAIEIEQRLLNDELKMADKKEQAELKEVMRQTGLGEATIRRYKSQADLNSKQISEAKRYNAALSELEKLETMIGKSTQTGAVDQDRLRRMSELKNEIQNTTSEVKAYATVIKAIGKVDSEQMGKFTESWIERGNIQQKYEAEQRRIKITMGRLEKGILDEGIKAEEGAHKQRMQNFQDEGNELNRLNKKIFEWMNQFIPGDAGAGRMTPIGTPQTVSTPGKRTISQTPTAVSPEGGFPSEILSGADYEKYIQDQQRAEAEVWNQRLSIAADTLAKIDGLVNQSFANRFSQIDIEAQKDEEAKQKELKLAGDNATKKDEIERKYAAKEAEREKERRRLQKEQAKYQKTAALIQSIVNTAVGVTGAVAATPGPVGIVMAALVLALGLAQTAMIASQPLPSYAKGRKGGKAELANINERGQEAVVTRSGDVYFPQGPLAYLPEGSAVIPHHELVDMAGRSATTRGLPDWTATDTNLSLRNEVNGLHRGFAMLAREIRDKKETHINITEKGIWAATSRGSVYEEWVNSSVRL